MPQRNDINKTKILRIIQNFDAKAGYITVSDVAKLLFCDWATARKHINLYPDCVAAFQAKGEESLDYAEKELFRVAKTDVGALKYLLSTKGKNRGYALPMVNGAGVASGLFDAPQSDENESGVKVLSVQDCELIDNILQKATPEQVQMINQIISTDTETETGAAGADNDEINDEFTPYEDIYQLPNDLDIDDENNLFTKEVRLFN